MWWFLLCSMIRGERCFFVLLYPRSTEGGVYCFTSVHVRPSVRPRYFRLIFLSNYWWQKSDIWSQASYRYAILWETFLDPSDSYFLFADLVGFYAYWTYMRGYHKWALAHSSSYIGGIVHNHCLNFIFIKVCGRQSLSYCSWIYNYLNSLNEWIGDLTLCGRHLCF